MEDEYLEDNTDEMLDQNENAVKVYLRFRPSNLDDQSCADSFKLYNNNELTVEPPNDTYAYKTSHRISNNEQLHRFEFTNIFQENTTQIEVYESSILPSVKHFLEGYNCLNFTYGVTNSGKTFTLVGNTEKPGLLHNTLSTIFSTINTSNISSIPHYKPEYFNGVIHTTASMITDMKTLKQELLNVNKQKIDAKCCNTIKDRIQTNQMNDLTDVLPSQNVLSTSNKLLDINIDDNIPTSYYIYISIAEIYNEKIFDLLNIKLINKLKPTLKKSPLSIGTDSNGFSYIKDLTYVLVKDLNEAFNILNAGTIQREVAMTNLNMQSSRSHVIYGLKIIKIHHLPNEIITKSHEMCFVDLAGSERPSKAQNEGVRFKEASNINLSLLVLGKCIEVLRHNRKSGSCTVVPFRESKLTRLLQPFFLSHSNINLFANISTNYDCFDETLNVLRFSALTMEALTRPMTTSLIEMNASNNGCNVDTQNYSNMNINELVHHIKYLKRNVDMLESEKHILEAKIRRECFEESSQVIKNIESKYETHLANTKNNIVELYKNKLIRLEEYYKELLEINLNETTSENNSLLSSLEGELNRKINEADSLKKEYNDKLEALSKKSIESSTINDLHIKEIESLNTKIVELEDIVSIKQNEITDHIIRLEESNNKIVELESELESVKNQLINKMTELEGKIEDYTKLTLELGSLHTIISENEEKISKLENRTIEDDPSYIDLKNELLETKTKLSTNEYSLNRCKRKIERDENRIKLLRDDIICKEETIRKLRIENFGLKDEISMVTAKFNHKILKNDPSLNDTTNISPICGSPNTISLKLTPTKKKSASTKMNSGNISGSPHNHNLSGITPLTEVSIPIESASEVSFRRLYEEAREYAYRMEQRVRELQIESLPSVPKTRRSIKRPISELNEVGLINDKKIATNENLPHITTSITSKIGIETTLDNNASTPNYKNSNNQLSNEINPSAIFRIDSTSPNSRKAATREYLKRLKGHDFEGKDNDHSIVNTVKKKLNLI